MLDLEDPEILAGADITTTVQPLPYLWIVFPLDQLPICLLAVLPCELNIILLQMLRYGDGPELECLLVVARDQQTQTPMEYIRAAKAPFWRGPPG